MKYNDDTIDLYIQKKLPAKKIQSLETDMAKDAVLAGRVKERKELLLFARLVGQRVRKEELKRIAELDEEEVHFEKEGKKSFRSFTYIAIIFGLLFCAFIVWKLIISPPSPPVQIATVPTIPLVEENFNASDITSKILGSETRSSGEPSELIPLYKNKNYAEAYHILQEHPKLESEYQLLAADTYFRLGFYDNALALCNDLMKDEDKGLMDDARWLAALIYLQKGEKSKAIENLEELVRLGAYTDIVPELLKEIEAQ